MSPTKQPPSPPPPEEDEPPSVFSNVTAAVATLPEVTEFYRMAGDMDYLLKVVVPSIEAFDGVYKRLIAS